MNTLKTFILLAFITGLFGIVGLSIGGRGGMMVALAFAAIMNFIAWWRSDKVVLAMYKAKPLRNGDVVDIVHSLAREAGLPLPDVYVIESDQPNAFATGRNPQNAAIAVTRGIVNILNEAELRGVIAHELAHIKNRDTLTMTITATLAGALASLAKLGMYSGGRMGARSTGRRGGGIGALLMMVLAPFAATLVQMAISRTREFEADRIGAEICHEPESLASALLKLEQSAHHVPNAEAERNPATAHMFIVNPLAFGGLGNVGSLFRTHPQTQQRVAALMEQAEDMGHNHHTAHVSSEPDTTPKNPWD